MARVKPTARQRRARRVWASSGRPSLSELSHLTGVPRSTLGLWRQGWEEDEEATSAPDAGDRSSIPFTDERTTQQRLASIQSKALRGLEQILDDSEAPIGSKVTATLKGLELSGITPPKRGSGQATDECTACAVRDRLRRHVKKLSTERLRRLKAWLEEE